MSYHVLNDEEQTILGAILEDLRFILSFPEILPDQVDGVIDKLKSDEVRAYLDHLRRGSKPEVALREAFIAGKAVLTKYFFGHVAPEINIGSGFIDYRVVAESANRFVVLELKSLFEAEVAEGKKGHRVLKRIRQTQLKPEAHKEQVIKYVREGGEYIILTNLKDWHLFNDNVSPTKFEPFYSTDVFQFAKDFEVIANLVDYLERKESDSLREGLDKKFFESLKSWVDKLSEVEFELDDRAKMETILGIVNKFVFIQTLDDYGDVDFRWIKSAWDHAERKWHAKGKLQVLKKFFSEVMEFFWQYYDTELFQGEVLEHAKQTDKNIDLLYRNLKLILGVEYWQGILAGYRGVIQYNFRLIDEDIFGKAYETFLGQVRHDEGIYYTPRYITEYVVENTVGVVFSRLLTDLKVSIGKEDLAEVEGQVRHFIAIRVLDPACGSGSFLIKAIRVIWKAYKQLDSALLDLESKYDKYEGKLVRAEEVEEKVGRIQAIRRLLKADNDRELVSHILVRHVHANDLDNKALAVAKVNVWLEGIKLAPKQFRYDTLPENTNYILPHLEMNFGNGDSVVGLPEDLTIEYLAGNHKNEIVRLFELRGQYLENPSNPALVEEIDEVLRSLRAKVDQEFKNFLKASDLPADVVNETKPFHWALEFWYLYFNENGEPLKAADRGTNVLIGNPPYERIQVLKKKSPVYVEYLDKVGYESKWMNYDLAVIFIERGYKLLRADGQFGYIVTNKFIQADYGEPIRGWLSKSRAVRELVDFGDQQVFEDATTYTALLFLTKTPNDTFKRAGVRKLLASLDQLRKVSSNEKYTDSTIDVSVNKAGSLTSAPWSSVTSGEESLFGKLNPLDKLGKKCRIFVGLQTSEDQVYILEIREELGNLLKVYSRVTDKEYELENKFLKPLLMGKDIKRWYIPAHHFVVLFPYGSDNGKMQLVDEESFKTQAPRTWKYLTDEAIKSRLEDREGGRMKGRPDWYGFVYKKNMDKFDLPKVMTQVLASRASFALDAEGQYYFPGGGNAGGYGFIPNADTGLNLEFLCGVLNSSLLNWYLKKISTRFRGGYYSFAKRFSGKLPIVLPKTENANLVSQVEETLKEIVALRKLRYRLILTWSTVSSKVKNSERKLVEILLEDAKAIRRGEPVDAWTSEVSFYPNGEQENLARQFSDFDVRGDADAPTVRIYGLTEENTEVLVYEMQFANRELMLHVYFSVLALLESKAQTKTLAQILEKTVIPVVQPEIRDSTPNIMRRVLDDLAKASVYDCDVAKVENDAEEAEARLDAVVSRLYGLDESEISIVLEDLGRIPSYQQRVLGFFASMK